METDPQVALLTLKLVIPLLHDKKGKIIGYRVKRVICRVVPEKNCPECFLFFFFF